MSFELDPGIGLQLQGKGIKIQEWDGTAWVDKYVVSAEGNTEVKGTLTVDGTVDMNSDLTVGGAIKHDTELRLQTDDVDRITIDQFAIDVYARTVFEDAINVSELNTSSYTVYSTSTRVLPITLQWGYTAYQENLYNKLVQFVPEVGNTCGATGILYIHDGNTGDFDIIRGITYFKRIDATHVEIQHTSGSIDFEKDSGAGPNCEGAMFFVDVTRRPL